MAIVAQGTTLQYNDSPFELKARTPANEREKRPGQELATLISKDQKNDNNKKESNLQDLYNPIIKRVMTLALNKVKCFGIKEFLR